MLAGLGDAGERTQDAGSSNPGLIGAFDGSTYPRRAGFETAQIAGTLQFPEFGGNFPEGYVLGAWQPFALLSVVALSHDEGFALENAGTNSRLEVSPGLHVEGGIHTSVGNVWASLEGRIRVPPSGSEHAIQFDGWIGSAIDGVWNISLGASRNARENGYDLLFSPDAAWFALDGGTLRFSYSENTGREAAQSLRASLWMEF